MMFGFFAKCKDKGLSCHLVLRLYFFLDHQTRCSLKLRACFGYGRRDMLSGSRMFLISCLETLETSVLGIG